MLGAFPNAHSQSGRAAQTASPTAPSISASPSIFSAGCSENSSRCATSIVVSGTNFPAEVQNCGVCVVVWLDVNGNGIFGGVDPYGLVSVDNTGTVSGDLLSVGDFPVEI